MFTCAMLVLAPGSVRADEPFTIAVIGDQQVPVHKTKFYGSFTAQTEWLAAHARAENIRFVTQVGDIIEHGDNTDQWDRAEAAMKMLDKAPHPDGGTGIPWNVAYGNHEVDKTQPGKDPAGARADRYRKYFGGKTAKTHRYAQQKSFGGVSPNGLNTYHIIRASRAADARRYLMLNLEYDVPGHAPGTKPKEEDVPAFDAIAWAQQVLDAHRGMPTVVTTHVFEGTKHGPPKRPYTGGPGRNSQIQIFEKLIRVNPQIFMVLSGHTSQDTHQVKKNAAGLSVLQMVTDFNKILPNGGDGFMRLIELDEEAGEIRVRTFSPGVPQNPKPRYREDANGRFIVKMDWSRRFDEKALRTRP